MDNVDKRMKSRPPGGELPDLLLAADRNTRIRNVRVFGLAVWPLLRILAYSDSKFGHVRKAKQNTDAPYIARVLREWRLGRRLDDVADPGDIHLFERVWRRFGLLFEFHDRLKWRLETAELRKESRKKILSQKKRRMLEEYPFFRNETLSEEDRILLKRITKIREDKPQRQRRYEEALAQQVEALSGNKNCDFLFVARPSEHYQKIADAYLSPVVDCWIKILSEYGHCAKIQFSSPDRELYHSSTIVDPTIGRYLYPGAPYENDDMGHYPVFSLIEYFLLKYHSRALAKINPDLAFNPRKLMGRVYHLRRSKRALRDMLLAINPQIVLFSSFSGFPALMWACHELGIPTVDLQHGGASDRNGLVSHYHRLPKEGYALLPNQLWCWDNRTTAMTNQWLRRGTDKHRAFETGNAFWELCGDGTIEKTLVPRERDFLATLRDKKVVLVTLIYGDNAFFPEILAEAILQQKTNGGNDCFWLIRMHGLNRERGHEIDARLANAPNNFDWRMATKLPLPLLLARTDVHITQFSSSWIEASWLDIPTAFVDPKVTDYFSDALKRGGNALCETTAALLQFVDRQKLQDKAFEKTPGIHRPAIEQALQQAGFARKQRETDR